jgi:hypothetical protein
VLGALLLVVLMGGGALLVAAIASGFEARPSSEAVAGHVDDFPPGSVTLLDLRSEASVAQSYVTRPPGGDVLALSRPALVAGLGDGCLTVWSPDEEFEGRRGVFKDPCRGSRHDIEGRTLFGPARDLDRYWVEVRDDGTVVVDLGDLRRQDRGGVR